MRQWVNFFLDAFSEVEMKSEALLSKGDLVAYRWTCEAVHTGSFSGVPATGKHVRIAGITIHRVRNGKVTDTWNEYNTVSVLQQLGILPSSGHAR